MDDKQRPAFDARTAGWLVAAVALVVFAPSLWDGFVYDDLPLIVDNPAAHDLANLPRNFTTHLWDVEHFQDSSRFNRYYRPLVSSSYTLNWVMGGGRAWVFHLTNILMHALAALLATRLACVWTRSAGLGTVAGLLFALHPTRSENVTWISGRTDVMMALFGFAAVWLFVRGAKQNSPVKWFAAGGLCLAASVLSKEGGMMMPLLIVASAAALPAGLERKRLGRVAVWTGVACAGYFVARMTLYPVRKGLGSVVPKYFLLTVQAYVERTVLPWPQVFFYRPLQIGPEGYDVSVWGDGGRRGGDRTDVRAAGRCLATEQGGFCPRPRSACVYRTPAQSDVRRDRQHVVGPVPLSAALLSGRRVVGVVSVAGAASAPASRTHHGWDRRADGVRRNAVAEGRRLQERYVLLDARARAQPAFSARACGGEPFARRARRDRRCVPLTESGARPRVGALRHRPERATGLEGLPRTCCR